MPRLPRAMPTLRAALRTSLTAAVALVAPLACAESRWVWFGTYTGAPPQGAGIYVARFDDATGTLSEPELAAELVNPSYLALHPTKPVLYAVSEVADADGRPTGSVVALAIDPETGRLTELNHRSSGGAGPCAVAVDRSGSVVLAANYGGGSSVCLGIEEDGSLRAAVEGEPAGFIQHVGKSVDPGRQEGPHGHSIDPTPDDRFAIVCDLGLDKVLVHRLDTAAATMRPHGAATVAPGAGPRHFALHPLGRHGYCINELDLTVTAMHFDPQAGTLRPFQSLSTIPAGVTDRAGFSTAEIAVHPSGRFLYGSNRGHDSIAMYAIEAGSGRLEFLGAEPIRGRVPRNFALDPSGKWLLAAGQDSHGVSVFSIDGTTGRLSYSGRTTPVPAPVCIVFR
ncbi:MAG: lactonase family protein [Planctomycetaceae bacterium]